MPKPRPIIITQLTDPESLLTLLRGLERERSRIDGAIRAIAEQLARLATQARGNYETREETQKRG
jgi:hypothetical protein